MKTLHKRCAGVDVHKTEVVACLRVVTHGKVEREVGSSAATSTTMQCQPTAAHWRCSGTTSLTFGGATRLIVGRQCALSR